jgi:hypothetical protein
VIAIETGDAVPDFRYRESDLGSVFGGTDNLSPDLDLFAGREGIQGDFLHQFKITSPECIIRQQSRDDNVSDAVIFKFLLQFRKQVAGPVQIAYRRAGSLAYHDAGSAGEGILHCHNLVARNGSSVFHGSYRRCCRCAASIPVPAVGANLSRAGVS